MADNFAQLLERIKKLVQLFPFSPQQQTEALGKYQITVSLRLLGLVKDRLTKEEQEKYFNNPPSDVNQWYKEIQTLINSRLDEKLAQEINTAILDETKIFCGILVKNCPLSHKQKLEDYLKENNLI